MYASVLVQVAPATRMYLYAEANKRSLLVCSSDAYVPGYHVAAFS